MTNEELSRAAEQVVRDVCAKTADPSEAVTILGAACAGLAVMVETTGVTCRNGAVCGIMAAILDNLSTARAEPHPAHRN